METFRVLPSASRKFAAALAVLALFVPTASAGTLVGVPIGGCPLIRPVGMIVRRRKPLGRTTSRLIELLQQSAGQLVAGGHGPRNR